MADKDDETADIWKTEANDEFEKVRTSTKIMVKRIPNLMQMQGLRNMCEYYGEVKSIRWPPGRTFAFVEYQTAAEAHNILRRFADDHPGYPVRVEIAQERDDVPQSEAPEEYDFLNQPKRAQDDLSMRNVLELSNRRITELVSDPAEFQWPSLIDGKDYRNMTLRMADPKIEFLWHSNEEATTTFESNKRMVVSGRSILKSCKINEQKEHQSQSSSNQKPMIFSTDRLPPEILCANCPRLALIMCKICNEPQCSYACHQTKHEEIVENADLDCEISKTETIKHVVKITAVINHRVLFVRPADKEKEIAFVRLMCDTVKAAKTATALNGLPKVGQFVLANFDYYQRALVLKHVSESKVVIAFIDYGNVETYDYHDLKSMPDHLKEHKRFATKIQLSGIDNDLMNDEALQYLYCIMLYNIELKIKFHSKMRTAELRAPDKWVNPMVNSLNQRTIKLPTPGQRVYYQDFAAEYASIKSFKECHGQDVIIINNSEIELSELSFIMAKDLKTFVQNDGRIQNICNHLFKTSNYYTPRTYECCVVLYENRWYRGYCLEIRHDGFATMHFIDFGNHAFIEICNIREIPDALFFPIFTITANCFPDQKDLSIDDLKAIRSEYPAKSYFMLEKIECGTEIIGSEVASVFMVWLKKRI